MDEISVVIGIIIGFIIGSVIGWLIFKIKSSNISNQSPLLSHLNTQIAELKIKFVDVEKYRARLDQDRNKYEEERERRLKEWMEGTQKLFAEQVLKNQKVDEEKDKRIGEWMEQTKKFFEEQKGTYTIFLEQQGKSREEIEKKRDAQIADMAAMIRSFTRTVSGTSTRGMMGEEQVREVLSNSIKAGVVACNLKTINGEIEFAWNLEDGKYIPIDCKLPDVFDLISRYAESEDITQQKQFKRQIIDKIKKEIGTVQKYKNLDNTIDSCILVVPEGILEIAPEIVGLGRESNVFVCSYKDVFPVAYVLSEKYMHFKEQGDIGRYRQIVNSLFQILERINAKTDTIQRGLTMITNANDEIKGEIRKSKQQGILPSSEDSESI